MRRVLVTGALGQIGAELVPYLRRRYGAEHVVASDLFVSGQCLSPETDGVYAHVDCNEPKQLLETIRRHEIGVIYHLAARLSVVAEQEPGEAWRVNMGGLHNLIDIARQFHCQMFFPSSIAAFEPSTPQVGAPQVTIQRPTTIYGVTKVAGELLCDYYASRFGVDVRGLRLPGLVSHVALPGGGTTDYAVEMFRAALGSERYSCFIAAETRLDMMYMPDAICAMVGLMEADASRLRYRNAYNISAMSITPAQLASEIRKHVPQFAVDYRVDSLRQSIADSWPRSLDCRAAVEDWDFAPRFDLATMTRDMLIQLRHKSKAPELSRAKSESSYADPQTD
jgi:nucleoside-diphosphate-sugar epimerase